MNIGDVKFSEILSENENSLMHHGIEGQKWGERNGPPYPLNPSKRSWREKRAAKRKEKILSDPNKLYKHASEFTKEEIEGAIQKYKSKQEVKPYTTESPKKMKFNKKVMSRTGRSLWKNRKRFSDEDLKKALDRIDLEHKVYDKKFSEISRLHKLTTLGKNTMSDIASGLGSWIKISDLMIDVKGSVRTGGLTAEQRRKKSLTEKGLGYLLKDPPKQLSDQEIKDFMAQTNIDMSVDDFKKKVYK